MCPALCNPMDCSMPGFPMTNARSLLKLMAIMLVIPSNHLTHLSPSPPTSIFPSIRIISNESVAQSIGVSAPASDLPMNIQDLFPLGWTGFTSLNTKGLSRVFSNTTLQKHKFFSAQLLYSPTLISIHDYWKNHGFDYMDLCW